MTMDLMYGLVTGVLFGFLLQKGGVLRYDKQIGALRLLDIPPDNVQQWYAGGPVAPAPLLPH